MNVLLVRLSAMGDIVHSLPLAENLRLDGHRVGWIVERPFARLLEGNPNVDEVFVVDTKTWRRRPLAASTLRSVAALARNLRVFRADAVLDAQANEKSFWVGALARSPRIVLDDRGLRRTRLRRISSARVAPATGVRHAVDQALGLLAPLHVPVRRRVPDARYLLSAAGEPAKRFLAATPRPFNLYHPGAGWGSKSWGEERYAELARRLDAPPVISWGPGDEIRAEKLSLLLGGAPRVPRLELPDLAAVLSEANLFVSGDTGPLHLADALGTRCAALFGPTDPKRNGPYSASGPALWAGLPCSPCNRRYRATKPCLSVLDPASVAEAIRRDIVRA